MSKTTRTNSSKSSRTDGRDLRALLHVPQQDLQAQLSSRLERLGFPALRPAHVQLLTSLAIPPSEGVRLSDLVGVLSLPKQTVGDLVDELEQLKLVERFQDPEHGVIKRVRLGSKGKVWAAEVKRVSAAAEAKWASQLGNKKMKSLRALLEELAGAVESEEPEATNGHKKR